MTGRTITFTVTLSVKNNESEAVLPDSVLWDELYDLVNNWWYKSYNWPSPLELDAIGAEIDTAADY